MKKITIAFCLFVLTAQVFAAQINFLENPAWETVLAKAKAENKIIFFDAFATWCGPCKSMDAQTYTNQAVADYYNANFINVKYDMEKGEGPKLAAAFNVTAYPSLIFVSADGKMLHKGVGFKDASGFLNLGKKAKEQATEFLVLKQKAQQLSNADFRAFVAQAIAFENEDLPQICSEYLAKQPDILANADLIDVVMTGVDVLPLEKDLAYFAANKAKIVATGKYTETAVNDKLVGLTLAFGVSNAVQKQAEKLDFEPIKVLLEKYVPERAFFVLNYYKTQYSFEQNDKDEALKAFNLLLQNTPAKLSFEQMCMALMNFGPTLSKSGQLQEVLTSFDTLQIPEKEANLSYLKDYVKVIIYFNTKDIARFKTAANALLLNTTTPENLKTELKSVLEKMGKEG